MTKALRFGLDECQKSGPPSAGTVYPTNRFRIQHELNDLMAVIGLLEAAKVLKHDWRGSAMQSAKKEKVQKYMDYARNIGELKQ